MILPGQLLLITDQALACYPIPDVVAAAVAAGCRWVLVREKSLSAEALATLVKEIMNIARPYNATVSVSGNPEAAAECGAGGVHLPREGSVAAARRIAGPNALIGVSAHSAVEAQQATAAGADYITLSPIFLTASKPGYGPALGLAELRRVAASLPIPVVALGGITADNAGSCLRAGAAGVAVMGALMRATDVYEQTRSVLETLRVWRSRKPITPAKAGVQKAKRTGFPPSRE